MLQHLSSFWNNIQRSLFPNLEEDLGPLSEKQLKLVTTLEILGLEDEFLSGNKGPGRPASSRVAIARAFVAKAIYNFSTTRMLIDRLSFDPSLRRICGFEKEGHTKRVSVFSSIC